MMKNTENVKNKSLNYIDFLNVISAVSVVILHTNGAFWTYKADRTWFVSNIIECVFYFAVPVFFMITGATLIDYSKRYSTPVYFKKRFVKTFIPFVAWSLFPVFTDLIKKIVFHRSGVFTEYTAEYFINGIFNTKFVPLYWFFIPLFCVYMCIPLFSAVDCGRKKSVFIYLAIVCFAVNILVPFVVNLLKLQFNISVSWPFSVSVGSGYLLYPVIGYLLHNYELKPKHRICIYIAAAAGLALHIFGTYGLSVSDGSINRFFKGYNNLPCLLYSVGIYVAAKQISRKITSLNVIRFFEFLRRYTFALYLIHVIVIKYTGRLFIRLGAANTSMVYVFIQPVFIIAICIFITFVLRKIPALKYIVP